MSNNHVIHSIATRDIISLCVYAFVRLLFMYLPMYLSVDSFIQSFTF